MNAKEAEKELLGGKGALMVLPSCTQGCRRSTESRANQSIPSAQSQRKVNTQEPGWGCADGVWKGQKAPKRGGEALGESLRPDHGGAGLATKASMDFCLEQQSPHYCTNSPAHHAAWSE